MLEGFEKFTKQGRSFKPKISIRKRGQIGFNNGSINKFNLKDFDFVVLYINKVENKIAFSFTNDSDADGVTKLIKRKNNYFVSGKSFLDFYGIPYDETVSMDAIWDEDNRVTVIQLEDKEEKPGNPGSPEEHEKQVESDPLFEDEKLESNNSLDDEFENR